MASLGYRPGLEGISTRLDIVFRHPLRSTGEKCSAVDVSVSSCHTKLQHRRRTEPRRCERLPCSVKELWVRESASTGSMGGSRGTRILASTGQEKWMGARSESDKLAGDDGRVTAFFSDELREAAEAMKERSRAPTFSETSLAGQMDENTFEGEETALRDDASDTEDEAEALAIDVLRKEHKGVKAKLPLETNGPPQAILQPYLAPDLPDDAQEIGRRKLRRLPLIVPHKMRPLETPASSRRSRYRSIISKRQGGWGTRNDLDLTYLPAEIQDLPAGTPVSQVLGKFVWRLKKGRLARPVRELGRMHLTKRVIEIVFWLRRYPHLWPDLTTLRTAIQVLVEEGEVDSAVTLWKEMGSELEGAAEALLSSLNNAGKRSETVNVVNDMKTEV